MDEVTTYRYDDRNRLIRTIHPDGSYTQTIYDLAGNVDRSRDRFGNWTDTDYDVYGRLVLTTYPDGSTEARTYTSEGLLDTVTAPSGRVTRNEYDDAGRLWRVYNDSDGTFTETRYNENGWVTHQYDANRNLTEYQYDLAGRRERVITHIDGRTQVHAFDYYPGGELRSETDALNRTTTYTLNELDQRTAILYHNGTQTQERFDLMGTRTHSIDQQDRRTRYHYDDLGRLTGVTPQVSIDGNPVPDTLYTYDEMGSRLTQTDAKGHTTTWTYDLFGRVLTRTLPELQQESFVYATQTCAVQSANIPEGEAASLCEVITHTDFNGDTITTLKDNMGRVDTVSYSKDGRVEQYHYYPDGKVQTVDITLNGVTETTTYTYYMHNDRLETETKPDGSVLRYDYDAVGNRTLVEISRNGVVSSSTSYTYDELNRLETTFETGTIGQATTYRYDAVGNLDTVTYPNGLITDYDYNDINQLTDVYTRNVLANIVQHFHYTLTPTGRREVITELDGRTTAYCYDELYRLTDEVIFDSLASPITSGCIADTTGATYVANYEYDWTGNRTYETVDGVQTAYTYDNNDRLTQTGGTVFEYDENGNTLTETLDANVTSYTYDGRNKLISVTKAGNTTDYTYNHNGIRTSKTEGGITTQFIVDENRDYAQVLEEITNGTQTVAYLYGHDLLSQERNGQVHYYHYDGLGSTRGLSDQSGSFTDTYDYAAFGEVLGQTGSTENAYLYTGEQFDAGLDQYYLRARYYNQGAGRFTQMDTWVGNPGRPITLNKYLYADVDPVLHIDPTGNFASLSGASAASNIQSTLATLTVRANYMLRAYDTVQAVSGFLDFASAVRQVMGQATSFTATDAARSGIPNINFQDAIESAAYNMPKAIATGMGNWGKGYSKSRRRGQRLQSFLIYMPLLRAGGAGAIPIRTPARVRFGRERVPVSLVFGGGANHSGTLFGLGMRMGNVSRQLVRMDYHRFNAGHGGVSGLQQRELAVFRDNDFHFHVNKWNPND